MLNATSSLCKGGTLYILPANNLSKIGTNGMSAICTVANECKVSRLRKVRYYPIAIGLKARKTKAYILHVKKRVIRPMKI